jgi:hypothetical protein
MEKVDVEGCSVLLGEVGIYYDIYLEKKVYICAYLHHGKGR